MNEHLIIRRLDHLPPSRNAKVGGRPYKAAEIEATFEVL